MRWIPLLAAAAGLAALVHGVREYVIDDTYIHLQYAKNVREGFGLVFNRGEPVAGTTSPLWSLLLAWAPAPGLDPVAASKLWSTAAGMGALFLFWLAARGLLIRWEHAAAATLAWSANAWMVRWSPSGMETSLAVLLVLAGWLLGRPSGTVPAAAPARRLAVSAIWSLAALARPEAAFLVAAYAASSALWPVGWGARASVGARGRALAACAGGVAVVLVPFALYSYSTYGVLLPGTLAAKSAGGTGLQVGALRLYQSARVIGAVCAVEALALVVLAPRLAAVVRRGDAALHLACLSWLALIPIGYAIRGVPVISRYLVPLLPLVVLYGWSAIERWRRDGAGRGRPVAATLALVVSLGINLAIYRLQVVPHTRAFVDGMERTLIPWGKWIGENTDPEAQVATPDIGAIGYYSNRRVLDLGGLVTPEIVPLMRRMGYDELVRSFAFREAGRPDYLVDRGLGPLRLLRQSPFAAALTPILTARTQSLGIALPGPVDYTLYRIDWRVVDSILEGEGLATTGSL